MESSKYRIRNLCEKKQIHAFHSGYWGNWMFQIDFRDVNARTISWSNGGFQEARGRPDGGAVNKIKEEQWYVENIFEELDAPNEWFYDEKVNNFLKIDKNIILLSEQDNRRGIRDYNTT